jgi:predicted ester cyclase
VQATPTSEHTAHSPIHADLSTLDVLERNKEIVRRIEAAWNAHDLDALDQYFSPDVIGNASVPYLPKALEGWKQAHTEMTEAYPDRQHFIEDMIAEGDKVVVRCRLVGTNTGGIHWLGVPPNGEPVDMQWICIYRLVEGRVVETWSFNDMLTLVRQMRADPELVVSRVMRGGWPLLVSVPSRPRPPRPAPAPAGGECDARARGGPG